MWGLPAWLLPGGQRVPSMCHVTTLGFLGLLPPTALPLDTILGDLQGSFTQQISAHWLQMPVQLLMRRALCPWWSPCLPLGRGPPAGWDNSYEPQNFTVMVCQQTQAGKCLICDAHLPQFSHPIQEQKHSQVTG